jgi:hypothetical protein
VSIGRTRIVEQRLCESSFATAGTSEPAQTGGATDEAFGEVLRHELNNPRTGNLEDGEILLAEFRRETMDNSLAAAGGSRPSSRSPCVRANALRRLSRLGKSYCAKDLQTRNDLGAGTGVLEFLNKAADSAEDEPFLDASAHAALALEKAPLHRERRKRRRIRQGTSCGSGQALPVRKPARRPAPRTGGCRRLFGQGYA